MKTSPAHKNRLEKHNADHHCDADCFAADCQTMAALNATPVVVPMRAARCGKLSHHLSWTRWLWTCMPPVMAARTSGSCILWPCATNEEHEGEGEACAVAVRRAEEKACGVCRRRGRSSWCQTWGAASFSLEMPPNTISRNASLKEWQTVDVTNHIWKWRTFMVAIRQKNHLDLVPFLEAVFDPTVTWKWMTPLNFFLCVVCWFNATLSVNSYPLIYGVVCVCKTRKCGLPCIHAWAKLLAGIIGAMINVNSNICPTRYIYCDHTCHYWWHVRG